MPTQLYPEIGLWRIRSSVCRRILWQKFFWFRITYSKELSNVQNTVSLCFGTITFSKELGLDVLRGLLFIVK